ncbi:Copper-sensing transcriptional repressor CsoR [compost metagenome]
MKKSKEVLHPDHGIHKKRLSRIKGQLEGIEKMIDDRRYCTDIVIQLRAAASALRSLENQILETHIEGCVKTAVASKNKDEAAKKIDEIMELIRK